MGQTTEWFQNSEIISAIIAFAPRLLGALGVLLAALVGATLLSRATRAFAERTGLEALLERVGASRVLYAIGVHSGFGPVLGRVVYWTVLAAGGLIALDTLGIDGLASVLDEFITFASLWAVLSSWEACSWQTSRAA